MLESIGCNPLEGMARIAKLASAQGDSQDLALAGKMFSELAQYVAPKRKAIEVTGADGTALKMDLEVTFL